MKIAFDWFMAGRGLLLLGWLLWYYADHSQ